VTPTALHVGDQNGPPPRIALPGHGRPVIGTRGPTAEGALDAGPPTEAGVPPPADDPHAGRNTTVRTTTASTATRPQIRRAGDRPASLGGAATAGEPPVLLAPIGSGADVSVATGAGASNVGARWMRSIRLRCPAVDVGVRSGESDAAANERTASSPPPAAAPAAPPVPPRQRSGDEASIQRITLAPGVDALASVNSIDNLAAPDIPEIRCALRAFLCSPEAPGGRRRRRYTVPDGLIPGPAPTVSGRRGERR